MLVAFIFDISNPSRQIVGGAGEKADSRLGFCIHDHLPKIALPACRTLAWAFQAVLSIGFDAVVFMVN
jgi:hypothetical protein